MFVLLYQCPVIVRISIVDGLDICPLLIAENPMETIKLNENAHIPVLGFGTWQMTGKECRDAVNAALDTGYRHIDTADRYGNHYDVGAAIGASIVPREEIFLTSKLWLGMHDEEGVRNAVSRFLDELQTDYIDLLLIHWPDRNVPFSETLGAMHEAKEAGFVRAIGVSNFTEDHLRDALKTGYEVAVNQVELHPGFPQHALREFYKENGIAVTTYSPLGRGDALEFPQIKALAEKYGATPGQVILNWIVARGMVAIPKSANPARIRENFQSLNFKMDEDDLERIEQLPETGRIVEPSFADFDY